MKVVVILLMVGMVFAAPMGSSGSAQQQASGSAPEETAASAEDPQEQLEEFVPTEEISADRAISFPTDI